MTRYGDYSIPKLQQHIPQWAPATTPLKERTNFEGKTHISKHKEEGHGKKLLEKAKSSKAINSSANISQKSSLEKHAEENISKNKLWGDSSKGKVEDTRTSAKRLAFNEVRKRGTEKFAKELCEKMDKINQKLSDSVNVKLQLRNACEEQFRQDFPEFFPKNQKPSKIDIDIDATNKKVQNTLETFNGLVESFKNVKKEFIPANSLVAFERTVSSCNKNLLPMLGLLDLITNSKLHDAIQKEVNLINELEELSIEYIDEKSKYLNADKLQTLVTSIKEKHEVLQEQLDELIRLGNEEMAVDLIANDEEITPQLQNSFEESFRDSKSVHRKLKTEEDRAHFVELKCAMINIKKDQRLLRPLKAEVGKMPEDAKVQDMKNKQLFTKLGVVEHTSLEQLRENMTKFEDKLAVAEKKTDSLYEAFSEKNIQAFDREKIRSKLNKYELAAFEQERRLIELRNELPVLVAQDFVEQSRRLPHQKEVDEKLLERGVINPGSGMGGAIFPYIAPGNIPLEALENLCKKAVA